jgi:hypothetical protein
MKVFKNHLEKEKEEEGEEGEEENGSKQNLLCMPSFLVIDTYCTGMTLCGTVP